MPSDCRDWKTDDHSAGGAPLEGQMPSEESEASAEETSAGGPCARMGAASAATDATENFIMSLGLPCNFQSSG
jgi:hypothetical protein